MPRKISEIDKIIGAKMKEVRLLNGLTMENTGKFLNITHQQIAKYENGINRITAGNLLKYAKAIGTTFDYYFEDNILCGVTSKRIQIIMKNINRMDTNMQQAFSNLTTIMVEENG